MPKLLAHLCKKAQSKRIATILGSTLLVFGSQAQAEEMMVSMDHTIPMNFSKPVASVVVGNPFIADVMAHSENMFFVVGKTMGTTNIVALDGEGNTISDMTVHVVSPEAKRLSLYRSTSRASYNCADGCQLTPIPGDDSVSFGAIQGQNSTKVSSAK